MVVSRCVKNNVYFVSAYPSYILFYANITYSFHLYFIYFVNKLIHQEEIKTKIKTKEHNNRQNFNLCIRNVDTNKERYRANKHF